jgi:glycerate-2-kinase
LRGGEVAVTRAGVSAAVREEARVGEEALCERGGVAEGFAVADATRALLRALADVNAVDVSVCMVVGGGAACLAVPPLASTTATVPATSPQKAETQAINALRDSRIEGHMRRR